MLQKSPPTELSLKQIMAMPVYPPADFFPMLAEDELQELAEDIKANGQREPIVVGEIAGDDGTLSMMLIDGRNRRDACRLACVVPQVRHFEGEDPSAFVLSVNVNRRHMTAGQRAAARALLKPEGEKGGRGKTLAVRQEFSSAEISDLSRARTIYRYEKSLLYSVLNGAIALRSAYEQACEIKLQQDSKEKQQEVERASLDALRKRYPDLARRVEEDGIGLRAMIVEADDRDTAAKSKRSSLFMGLRNARAAMVGFAASDELPRLPDYLRSAPLRKEFVETFRDDPSALGTMVRGQISPIFQAPL